MKQFYVFIGLLFTSVIFAQIPANYYNSANGLTGYQLKTQLKTIISNGHTARTYDQLYDGVGVTGSQGYIDTHSDINVTGANNYENDGTVLDMYSENPNGNDPYNFTHNNQNTGNQNSEGDCYNREHLVPQSSFNSNFPMQSDIHHVIPSDCRVNNFRGSLAFGTVGNANWTSLNGSKRGTSNMQGFGGIVFEPIDEFKGDIARALLYFAVRYEDNVDNYTSFVMFNGTNDEVFFPWAISVLLDWHNNVDPVDAREIARNNEAYNFQGNANPFVDNPQYANMIWSPNLDTQAPTAPTNLVASNPTQNTIDLSWSAATDNVGVINYEIYSNNVLVDTTPGTSTTVMGLSANTQHCFNVVAKDAGNNSSPQSNQACETTLPGTSTSNELFISEYVEGSSNNKAIEIANFTGATVNLSSYSLARDSNSNGNWTGNVALNNVNLNDGEVYVLARGNASSAIQALTDQAVGNGNALDFNGDDPVGLFKNGTLIDVFGNFGGSNSFSNSTYRRKPSVTQPTTAFDLAGEWDMYPQDNIDDLGNHTTTLSVSSFNTELIDFYPNPVNTMLHINYNVNTINVEIYNVLGKLVIKQQLSNGNSTVNVQNLKTGVYIVRMTTNNTTITKRLIKK